MDKKEQAKLRMKKYRERNKSVTDSVTFSPNSVTKSPESVTRSVESVTQLPEDVRPDAWEKLHGFIQRGNNLEKLQRVCGSLGGYAGGVWMGDLNLQDIGEVIGVKQGLYAK